MTQLPLYRPLNMPVVAISVDHVDHYFLIDTGCSISFAHQLRSIPAGSLLADRAVELAPAPFSLGSLSETLGVPIEGFIGRRELRLAKHISFDWDQGSLRLGVVPSHPVEHAHPSEHYTTPQETQGDDIHRLRPSLQHRLELIDLKGTPIGLRGSIDGQEATWFVDTGTRFITLPRGHEITLAPHRLRYETSIVSPHGHLDISVSPQHHFTFGSLTTLNLCVAEGSPPASPMVLGAEWLTLFNLSFDFEASQLTLTARRLQGERRPAWEALSVDRCGPPFEISLDPQQIHHPDRAFTLLPRVGSPLPLGLWPFTPYHLKDCTVPAGPEGVNALYEALTPDIDSSSPLVLTDNQGGSHTVARSPLFSQRS